MQTANKTGGGRRIVSEADLDVAGVKEFNFGEMGRPSDDEKVQTLHFIFGAKYFAPLPCPRFED